MQHIAIKVNFIFLYYEIAYLYFIMLECNVKIPYHIDYFE